MSLTSHLKQPQSPVYQFLAKGFPGATAFAKKVNQGLEGIETIRPSHTVPYSTIGTALDYRIRYYFQLTPHQELVAWHGACLLYHTIASPDRDAEVHVSYADENGEPLFGEELMDFFSSLDTMLRRSAPVGRRLDRPQEELLARYCVVLALFEEVRRAYISRNSPLYELKKRGAPSVDNLLAIAQPHWVDDLCQLSWLFYDRYSNVLAVPAVLNPTFDGSIDVGGADADLILDGYLLDIKTTVNPILKPQWLYQLIGYVLLDYSDSYQSRGVGFYLARQGLLLQWPLSEFMKEMMADEAVSLNEWRSRFRELLSDMRKKQQEGREWHHRQLQAKWAREVIRRWREREDPQALQKRRELLEPTIKEFLEDPNLSEKERESYRRFLESLREGKPREPSKRERKSYERAVRLLEEYEQEKAQRLKTRRALTASKSKRSRRWRRRGSPAVKDP